MSGNSHNSNDDAEERVDFASLLPPGRLQALVQQWLHDDIATFDVGGLVVGAVPRTAFLWMKSSGIVAGIPIVDAVFQQLHCQVKWHVREGESIRVSADCADCSSNNNNINSTQSTSSNKIHIATVSGPVHKLLQGERTALNALSRCSGVATASRQAVTHARQCMPTWKGSVAGTRKTTPGFGLVEKYGLLVGGAATHRLDLSQMCMLKDNHIWSAGSICKAVTLAKRAGGFSQKVEVECQNLEEAREAAMARADIVMLDNIEPDQLKEDAAALKHEFPHLLIEASGGITTETMKDYLSEHVDIISQGKLTQGYDCIDFSLKICQDSTSNTA